MRKRLFLIGLSILAVLTLNIAIISPVAAYGPDDYFSAVNLNIKVGPVDDSDNWISAVGVCSVYQDEDGNVHMRIRTYNGWYLFETHVDWAEELTDIPQTKAPKNGLNEYGNPIPGQFEWGESFSPPITSPDFADYNLGPISAEIAVFVVHAVVGQKDCDGWKNIQTAWGDCMTWDSAKWAKYWTAEIPSGSQSSPLLEATNNAVSDDDQIVNSDHESMAGGMPAAHGVDGKTFGSMVSELAKSEPGAVADHVKNKNRP